MLQKWMRMILTSIQWKLVAWMILLVAAKWKQTWPTTPLTWVKWMSSEILTNPNQKTTDLMVEIHNLLLMSTVPWWTLLHLLACRIQITSIQVPFHPRLYLQIWVVSLPFRLMGWLPVQPLPHWHLSPAAHQDHPSSWHLHNQWHFKGRCLSQASAGISEKSQFAWIKLETPGTAGCCKCSLYLVKAAAVRNSPTTWQCKEEPSTGTTVCQDLGKIYNSVTVEGWLW